MTPIPDRVADPKDAVLWAVLNKLETIDENQSTRIAFATSILYNCQFGLDKPIFSNELEQVRKLLGLPEPEAEVQAFRQPEIRDGFDATAEVTMRDVWAKPRNRSWHR